MKDTEYAYAVSSIRSMENELLTSSFIEQLLDSPDYRSALNLLSDKGYNFQDGNNIQKVLNQKAVECWNFLMNILPDKNALDFLAVKNDFHNLKASLKSIVADVLPNDSYIYPSLTDTDALYSALKEKQFDKLPKWLSEPAKQSYEILTSTMDGQLFDLYVDNKALCTMQSFAKNTQSELAQKICEIITALSDIKIALRACKSPKSDVFYEYAFAPCSSLDIATLKSAALKGKEDVIHYIEGTTYSSLTSKIAASTALFEKECEDIILRLCDDARRISFGVEPLIAYYFAVEAQNKTLRIILNAKHSGFDKAATKERMRELYV